MVVDAREITAPVDLQTPRGLLNPDAVGWTRTPQHRTDRVGRVARRWGRAKRWEYWAVATPTHVVALTVSSLDYIGLTQVWVLDRATHQEIDRVAVVPFALGTHLPGTLGGGPSSASSGKCSVRFDEQTDGTRLRASTPRVLLDVVVGMPEGHQRLGVVVPWNERTFQYTVKDIGRPVTGRLRVDGVVHDVPEGSWAVLDHGRGYWPRELSWNWGFGAGVVGGRQVALQLGGRWTDGTGSTENAVFIDGRMRKVREELAWTWTPGAWTDPWRVRGTQLDLTFTPCHERVSLTDLKVVRSSTHQCFGRWTGWVALDDGSRLAVDGLFGSVEDVQQRW
ncbi:MAG: DUF2804 domain-containing protein [Micrococcales bacterium]|nr:DUF2804 domain-containing protein [Micrococcales bacterium]